MVMGDGDAIVVTMMVWCGTIFEAPSWKHSSICRKCLALIVPDACGRSL